MRKLTGGEAIVESLIAQGVDTVFGLPGAQLDPVFAALHDRQSRIRIVHSRHEQGCAYMAFGYAEASGDLGVLLVVPGPGLLNAAAGIVTGYACNTPMLCLAGQGRAPLIGRGFGILHEIPNQLETARGLVKWAGKIDHASEIPARMAEAVGKLREGRSRPVYLECPFDLAKAPATIPAPIPAPSARVAPPLDEEEIAAAAEVLAQAECPLIMAGGGARQAGPELQALAERLGAPVAMSENGLGALDCRHPLAFTPAGAYRWWAKADAVLAVGTRLFPTLMAWGRDRNLKIVKLDIDAAELRRLPPPIQSVHGEAGEALAALAPALEVRLKRKPPDRSEAAAAIRKEVAEELRGIAPLAELLGVLRQELGEGGILVADLTQLYFAAQDAFPVHRPRTFIHPSYQGTLGHAAATALGAKLAAGGEPVVALAGDGGFLFTVQELATAAQYGIGATFLVMNDGAFGNVKRILQNDYGGRAICTDLRNPDFVKLAESFGLPGRRVDSPESLSRALRESFAESGPALIEYRAPEFPSPWPLRFRAPVRG